MKRKGKRVKNKIPTREAAPTIVERAADIGADAIRRYLQSGRAKARNIIIMIEIDPWKDEPECTTLTEGFTDPEQILKTILHHAKHTAQGMGHELNVTTTQEQNAEKPDTPSGS